jgi:predicted ATPase
LYRPGQVDSEPPVAWDVVQTDLAAHESMLAWVVDPRATPEVVTTRHRIRGWRFYDQFRSDRVAPARAAHVGTRTIVLAHDGYDLAAAVQTILEVGDAEGLAESVDEAFPGATLEIEAIGGRFQLRFRERVLLRPLGQEELSDGTLRYLLWIAALHSPRAPELMVLNEPETSLHGTLLPPLGRMILRAARRCQVVAVSHAPELLRALMEDTECNAIVLGKDLGETKARCELETPAWSWPTR